jgi:O-antigen/teichoic acid export membrane protein
VMSSARVRGDAATMRRLFTRAAKINAVIVYALTASILWAVPWLSFVIAPSRPGDLTVLIQILVPIYAIYSVVAAGYYTLQGLRAPLVTAASMLLGTTLTLGAMWLLTPTLGINAAAWSNAGFLVFWLVNVAAGHRLKMSFQELIMHYSPFFASLAFCAAVVGATVSSGRSVPFALAGWTVSILLCYWIDQSSVCETLASVTAGAKRLFQAHVLGLASRGQC